MVQGSLILTDHQRRSKAKVKRARHKRARQACVVSGSCECRAREMKTCPHQYACLHDTAAQVEDAMLRSTTAANKSAKWIEDRLAQNKAARQAACTIGVNCRCEGYKEFFGCANSRPARLGLNNQKFDELMARGRE